MARYDYRCADCGVYEVDRPVGTAEPEHACPGCSKASRRQFSGGALLSGNGPLSRARDAERASAHEPSVVRAVPPGPARRRAPAAHPLHSKLPRP